MALLHSNVPGACIPRCDKCKNARWNQLINGIPQNIYCIYKGEYPTEPCQGFRCVDTKGVPYLIDYVFDRDVEDAVFKEIPNTAIEANLESQRLDNKEFNEKDINSSSTGVSSTDINTENSCSDTEDGQQCSETADSNNSIDKSI